MRITFSKEELAAFCRRHRIRKLAFFGSVLRDDFGPESDVDVLVEFEPGARVGLITLAGMEIELGRLLGLRVELYTVKGLNRHFHAEVLSLAEVQYEQTLSTGTLVLNEFFVCCERKRAPELAHSPRAGGPIGDDRHGTIFGCLGTNIWVSVSN